MAQGTNYLCDHPDYHLDPEIFNRFFIIALMSHIGDIGTCGGGGVHGGRVVTLSLPTSEIRVQIPPQPQVGKLVVACFWSVDSTEP